MKPSARPLAACLLMGAAFAQSSPPLGARLKMRWQGSTVFFRDGGAAHQLALRDQFHAVWLDTVVLQSAKEMNGLR